MIAQKIFLPGELITKVLNPKIKSIFLLGGPDTGKTTLMERLIGLLKNNFLLGIIDSDMGQSHIGLPTTVAWAKVKDEFSSWQNLVVEDFRFIGSLSPAANTQRVLEAVEFIFKKAKAICSKVVIDTTGYIQGFEAVEFKIKKIRLLRPDLVIALKKENELEPILKEVEKDILSIFGMDLPSGVRQKSSAERALYRQNLFKEYFSSGTEVLFNASAVVRWDNPDEELIDKLVSLRNCQNEDLALGVIKKEEDSNIWVLTPFKKIKEVSWVMVGNWKWQD